MPVITRSKYNQQQLLKIMHGNVSSKITNFNYIQNNIDINIENVNNNISDSHNVRYIGFYNQLKSIIYVFNELSILFKNIPPESTYIYEKLFKTTRDKIKEFSLIINAPMFIPRTKVDSDIIKMLFHEMKIVKSQLNRM